MTEQSLVLGSPVVPKHLLSRVSCHREEPAHGAMKIIKYDVHVPSSQPVHSKSSDTSSAMSNVLSILAKSHKQTQKCTIDRGLDVAISVGPQHRHILPLVGSFPLESG